MTGARGYDSSDDDIEVVPNSVDNYWLEDADETPVSFADLPYFKTGEESLPKNNLVYVRGTQDNGTRMFMRAMAWKLEFTKGIQPVFHLKTEKYWIKLQKPRKSFEKTIRSIISTATFLNYALVNPRDTEKAAWNHVKDVYKSWDVAPSRDDLASHLLVIQHLIQSNEFLASSVALQLVRVGGPRKRLASARENAKQSSELHQYKHEKKFLDDEKESDICVNDVDIEGAGDSAETVCWICDDGGEMICCDGPCMRSFHFKDASCGSSTLGLSKIEADQMDKFFCPNCKFKRHQCFACGELGCSDDGAGATCEVFVCGAKRCGHFYHPRCVAELVLKDKKTSEQVAMAESIKEGKKFVCPVHKCWKCGQVEVKEAWNLQFGICRRCPRVWHRQCLPSSLLQNNPKRCWHGLLPNKILVYCNQHTIIPELATPARNHVKFPEGSMSSAPKKFVKGKAEEKGKKSKPSRLDQLKKKVETNLKSPGGHTASKSFGTKRKLVALLKQTKPGGCDPTKSTLKQSSIARDQLPAKKRIREGVSANQELSPQRNEQKCNSQSEGKLNLDTNLARTSATVVKSASPKKSTFHFPQAEKALVCSKTLSAGKEGENMVNDIIEGAKASISIESVLRKHEVLANSTQFSKNQGRKLFLGKLESIVKGMGKAVETLENGGSIEDAKLHCPQDYISYMKSCSADLELYLAPLIHDTPNAGGRLMKQKKLKAAVDRLHWYLGEYDVIVDVTCGSHDFWSLLKKKLEESGKVCEYRNFDVIQTSNDCSFSKRDWFDVKPSELPGGDRLIIQMDLPMGLRANRFIDHALTFRPKLIVVMVPKEVQRLDLKCGMYDLVWEDPNVLEGLSFNFQGPTNGQEKPSNSGDNVPCLLYLWSRPDWTHKYKQIAVNQGHIFDLTRSHFTGSPLKASSSRPPLHSDFDTKMSCDNEAREEEERARLGKSKYSRSQGGEASGGGETSGDLEKLKSNILQVEDKIMKEPIGGQGSTSTPNTPTASKLDPIMRRRGTFKRDGSEHDVQVSDNSSKSYKVETTSNSSKNDGFVPPKQPIILKRKGVDSSFVEPSGSQSTQCSSEGSQEKARNSSEHGVSRKERKTDDNYLWGDKRRNVELVHGNHFHKMTSAETYVTNNEADLRENRSPAGEPGPRKVPDKHGISKQGDDRSASAERSQNSCMPSEPRIESMNKSHSSSVEDLGKKLVSKDEKTEDCVKMEIPKSVSRHDAAAQYEVANWDCGAEAAPSAQKAQLVRCNAQIPGHYNVAASTVTLNRHACVHLQHPPTSGMQYGTGHPSGSSGTGKVHFLPQGQRPHPYLCPGVFTPSTPAPLYSPLLPVHLPPGYGPQYYGPAPVRFQRDLLQRPPFLGRPPNQKNTGGWFED